MAFKPSQIKENVQSEKMSHKARIVVFSLIMGGISSAYQTYFNNVTYRSAQAQEEWYTTGAANGAWWWDDESFEVA